jgi:hypothetical protein
MFVDRKDPSDRYYFEELVDSYFHTCTCYLVARKKITLSKDV